MHDSSYKTFFHSGICSYSAPHISLKHDTYHVVGVVRNTPKLVVYKINVKPVWIWDPANSGVDSSRLI